jgi:hypothetical protein
VRLRVGGRCSGHLDHETRNPHFLASHKPYRRAADVHKLTVRHDRLPQYSLNPTVFMHDVFLHDVYVYLISYYHGQATPEHSPSGVVSQGMICAP